MTWRSNLEPFRGKTRSAEQELEEKRRGTYTPINDKHPDSTDPATLVAGRATPTDAMHIAAPMTCVKVRESRGTNGKAASVPSALAMARLERDGVGEKGRRAWPPRNSSRERMVAKMGESSDMVSELKAEGALSA